MDFSQSDVARINDFSAKIKSKFGLHKFYSQVYEKYKSVAARSPQGGRLVEIGSGGGFAKEVLPELTTSETANLENLDMVVDGLAMPFSDSSVSAFFMCNVFHHIPDARKFLSEVERCLLPGGRLFMVDQHWGWINSLVIQHIHHEPWNGNAEKWEFDTSGPLSGANGALSWIVFKRDREVFRNLFPNLELLYYRPHTPISYWLTGGSSKWNLVTRRNLGLLEWSENVLMKVSPNFGSFVDIELKKLEL